MASFQAAGTSYATHGHAMIPFYIFYSMFGFQRTGDQMWSFGDARGRGFLMGATAGRTTLAGEGLQHDDGHSHILASTIPSSAATTPPSPTSSPRSSATASSGCTLKAEDVYYYITLYNENYAQPAKPEGVDEGILRGIYRFAEAPKLGKDAHPARLVGSGSILNAGRRGARPAGREVRRGGRGLQRAVVPAAAPRRARGRALEPAPSRRQGPRACPYVTPCSPTTGGPIVAATDWMKALPDMVARWLPPHYLSLGTDGFGRSGTREDLRAMFEIDPPHIAAATLVALARCGDAGAGQGGQGDSRPRHRP